MNTLEKIIDLVNSRCTNDQQFLSDLNFNRTLLSDWKSGKSKSYLKHINKIAEYFNVSTDYLLGNEQKEKAPSQLSERAKRILEAVNQLSEEEQEAFLLILEKKEKK